MPYIALQPNNFWKLLCSQIFWAIFIFSLTLANFTVSFFFKWYWNWRIYPCLSTHRQVVVTFHLWFVIKCNKINFQAVFPHLRTFLQLLKWKSIWNFAVLTFQAISNWHFLIDMTFKYPNFALAKDMIISLATESWFGFIASCKFEVSNNFWQISNYWN